MIEKVKVSFSILEPWSRGDYDEAIRRFYKMESEPTQAMIDGRELHKEWEEETKKTGCLPKIFGGDKLEKPEVERYLTCMIDDWIEFVGVVDVIESSKVFSDYKTGKGSVNRYSATYQIPCNQLLLFNNGHKEIDKAYLRHYNSQTKEVTTGKLYLGPETLERGEEWIRTWASEIKSSIEDKKAMREGLL